MADNVAITAGAGTSIATDEVSSVHYQKFKLAIGAADTANLLSVGSGAIDTGTPRFTLATDSPGITALGQATATNSLPVIRASDAEPAHDSADSGIGTKIAAKATTALSALTLVADNDRTDLFAGLDGVLIVRPHCNLEAIVTGNATNTDGTSTQCIAAQAAGIKTYLTSVVLCNTSATAITVDIKDGATTKISMPLPAGSGAIFNPPVPVPGTAATAWNFDPSAAASTVTCSMVGFKSKA